MQIHHVEVITDREAVLDPTRGKIVLKDVHSIGASGVTAITSPVDGSQIDIGSDGTFEVDGPTAELYLRREGWVQGPNPFHKDSPRKSHARAKSAG